MAALSLYRELCVDARPVKAARTQQSDCLLLIVLPVEMFARVLSFIPFLEGIYPISKEWHDRAITAYSLEAPHSISVSPGYSLIHLTMVLFYLKMNKIENFHFEFFNYLLRETSDVALAWHWIHSTHLSKALKSATNIRKLAIDCDTIPYPFTQFIKTAPQLEVLSLSVKSFEECCIVFKGPVLWKKLSLHFKNKGAMFPYLENDTMAEAEVQDNFKAFVGYFEHLIRHLVAPTSSVTSFSFSAHFHTSESGRELLDLIRPILERDIPDSKITRLKVKLLCYNDEEEDALVLTREDLLTKDEDDRSSAL